MSDKCKTCGLADYDAEGRCPRCYERRSELAAPAGSDLEIPCPNGCDPKTAPKPNLVFCPACGNTGWAKPGVMAEKSEEVEVRFIPARITTGNVFRDAMANNRGISTNS